MGRDFPPYRRTFPFPGDFVDDAHRLLAEMPVEGGLISGSVPGFLRPADALALYEHAHCAEGDVLEMGSAWGLSTTILCRAVARSGRSARVVSLEIAPEFQAETARAVAAEGLSAVFEPRPGDAAEQAERLIAEGRTFGFAFIDHDHAYEPTKVACRQLARLLSRGGYALFHDFNDERNRSDPGAYGVHRAVSELAQDPGFRFLGVIGCSALARRIA